MNQQTNIATIQKPEAITMGFGNQQSFELMQRAAKLLSSSTLVPAAYRAWDEKRGENPSALANCVVSLNMAQRMGADPLMVMQNLYIVEGRPSWSSQWIIAAINGCGRFSPLRFDLKDLGPKEVEYEVTKWLDRQRITSKHTATVHNLECVAWAIEKETGARIDSPKVSLEMAVKEGWYGKSGSKWQTMPEVMLRYRTASFFGKIYAPELLMGLQTAEEMLDIVDVAPDGTVSVTSEPIPPRGKPTVVMPQSVDTQHQQPPATVDQSTGEIHQAPATEAPADKASTAPGTMAAEPPAAQPTKPAATPKAKPSVNTEAGTGALATENERKFVINRARNKNLVLTDLLYEAGLGDMPPDLQGLTKDGFTALVELLPKAQ